MAESEEQNLSADGQCVSMPTETESKVLCGASSHPTGTNKVNEDTPAMISSSSQ